MTQLICCPVRTDVAGKTPFHKQLIWSATTDSENLAMTSGWKSTILSHQYLDYCRAVNLPDRQVLLYDYTTIHSLLSCPVDQPISFKPLAVPLVRGLYKSIICHEGQLIIFQGVRDDYIGNLIRINLYDCLAGTRSCPMTIEPLRQPMINSAPWVMHDRLWALSCPSSGAVIVQLDSEISVPFGTDVRPYFNSPILHQEDVLTYIGCRAGSGQLLARYDQRVGVLVSETPCVSLERSLRKIPGTDQIILAEAGVVRRYCAKTDQWVNSAIDYPFGCTTEPAELVVV